MGCLNSPHQVWGSYAECIRSRINKEHHFIEVKELYAVFGAYRIGCIEVQLNGVQHALGAAIIVQHVPVITVFARIYYSIEVTALRFHPMKYSWFEGQEHFIARTLYHYT